MTGGEQSTCGSSYSQRFRSRLRRSSSRLAWLPYKSLLKDMTNLPLCSMLLHRKRTLQHCSTPQTCSVTFRFRNREARCQHSAPCYYNGAREKQNQSASKSVKIELLFGKPLTSRHCLGSNQKRADDNTIHQIILRGAVLIN